MDDVQQKQAHERVNLSLSTSLDMGKVGENGTDLEFENSPEEEEVSIPNVKKPRWKKKPKFCLKFVKTKSNLKIIGQNINLMAFIITTVAKL